MPSTSNHENRWIRIMSHMIFVYVSFWALSSTSIKQLFYCNESKEVKSSSQGNYIEKIIIEGGHQLRGTVNIEGAKNSILPILAAALLAEEGTTILNNVPIISDVYIMSKVIKHLDVDINFDEDLKQITIAAAQHFNVDVKYEYSSQIRASIFVLGPMLARNGLAKVALPGGCDIGTRPIDFHLKGLKALGAKISKINDYFEVVTDGLIGNTIKLDFPSVGATQNIMMAAVKASGTTFIKNAAREPEVVDLANFLIKMGANIVGAGTEEVQIKGVDKLHAVEYTIIKDRIETGTFMIAASLTEGDVMIEGAITEHNFELISKLTEMGALIREEEDGVRVIGPKKINPVDVKTLPYPGFPTDMQAPITVMQIVAEGQSSVNETIFEARFEHLKQMQRMNANVKMYGNIAVIRGTPVLKGADVDATDLRAAAALILAGLRADGVTRVSHINYLDRGYYKLHEKLKKLGAKIERTYVEKSFKR